MSEQQAELTDDKSVTAKCPHCGEQSQFVLTAKVKENYRLKLRLTPHEGCLLGADTVGSVLSNISKMLDAGARELGCGTKTFIEGITVSETGELEVRFLTADFQRNSKRTRESK